MKHKNNFKGQLDDEIVIFFFRRHWSKILTNLFMISLIFICFILVFLFDFGLVSLDGQDVHNLKWVILIVLTVLTGLLHFQ
ncbi:MAG: hypothetical protein AAB664_01875, partial [Patescibacteria group bacterium]